MEVDTEEQATATVASGLTPADRQRETLAEMEPAGSQSLLRRVQARVDEPVEAACIVYPRGFTGKSIAGGAFGGILGPAGLIVGNLVGQQMAKRASDISLTAQMALVLTADHLRLFAMPVAGALSARTDLLLQVRYVDIDALHDDERRKTHAIDITMRDGRRVALEARREFNSPADVLERLRQFIASARQDAVGAARDLDTSVSAAPVDTISRLERLAALYERDLLTAAEYEMEKKRILGEDS